jgi:hypothetical protein
MKYSLYSLTVTPFHGMGTTSKIGSVTYVLRICVTYVLRIFCYLSPRTVHLSLNLPDLFLNIPHVDLGPDTLKSASIVILVLNMKL